MGSNRLIVRFPTIAATARHGFKSIDRPIPNDCRNAATQIQIDPAFPDAIQVALRNRLRWKIARLWFVLEVMMLVARVAERLFVRMAAAAERDGGAASQTVGVSFGIDDLEIPLDFQRSVSIDGNFCRHGCTGWLLRACEYVFRYPIALVGVIIVATLN